VPPASDTVLREGLTPKAETQLCGSVHESPVRFTARAIAVTRIMNGSSIDSVGDAPLEKNELATNAADKNEAAAGCCQLLHLGRMVLVSGRDARATVNHRSIAQRTRATGKTPS
jgi:hypothetical protein